MINMIKRILLLVSTVVLMTSCGNSDYSQVIPRPTRMNDYYTSTSLDAGDYQFISCRTNAPMRINSLVESKAFGSAIVLGSSRSDMVIDTQSIFTVQPLNTSINGTFGHYISSPCDLASIFYARSLNSIVFVHKDEAVNDRKRQIHTELTYDSDNKTYIYRFFFYTDKAAKYYLSAGKSLSDSNFNKIRPVKESDANDESTYYPSTRFYVKKVHGETSKQLESRLYVTNGEEINFDGGTEVDRVLQYPRSGSSYPKYSKPFSFAINGDEETVNYDTTYNGCKRFAISYNDNSLTLSALFTYQSWWKDYKINNQTSFTWSSGMYMDATDDSKGNNIWTLKTIDGFPDSAHFTTGSFVLQREENNKWVNVCDVRFPDPNYYYTNSIKIDWRNYVSTYSTGFRLCFLYRIGYGSSIKTIVQKSEVFYLRYVGVSDKEFLPIKVSAISKKGSQTSETGIQRTDNYFGAETLLPGSCAGQSGFYVEPLINGYSANVLIYEGVGLNSVYQKTVTIKYGSSQSFTTPGRYVIKVYNDALNKVVKEGSIYVIKDNLGETFFKKVFSYHEDQEDYFIRGERIFSGKLADEYADLGIYSKFTKYVYPTYYQKVNVVNEGLAQELNAFGFCHLDFYKYNETRERYVRFKEIYPGRLKEEDIEISGAGLYMIEAYFDFNPASGHWYSYRFNFYIVDSVDVNTINYQIKEHTQEVYDLKPFAYTVFKDYATIQYKSGDELLNKEVPTYYVLYSYNDALLYALSKCKKYVTEVESGLYHYYDNGEEHLVNEIEAFNYIYSLAESLIDRKTMGQGDSSSLYDFDLESEIAKVYESIEEVPTHYLITTNKDQLSLLTDRVFMNEFEFITDTNKTISTHVELYNDKGELIEEDFPYFTKVEDYMVAHNLENGKYTFIDYSVGLSNVIKFSYVRSKSDEYNYCDTTLDLLINEESLSLSMEDDGKVIENSNEFTLLNGFNIYDKYSLIKVTKPDHSVDLFISDEVINLTYKEKGKYLIHIEDRLGNFYEITVFVGAENE